MPPGPGILDHQPELDALVRLQAEDQPVRLDRAGARVEDRMRDARKATTISETRAGSRLPVRR